MNEDITPEAILAGTPTEPTPYYNHASYSNPDYDLEKSIVVGQFGVLVPGAEGTPFEGKGIVISVVNGSLCANPLDEPPVSINFEQYIPDIIHAGIKVVVWDPETERYVENLEDREYRTWQ